MSLQSRAIGGYFELELPKGPGLYYPDALKYQSARAAFVALLQYRKPRCVWMPYYVCNSMLAPMAYLGIDVKFYSINLNFEISSQVDLRSNDLLLYVNYFGVCSSYEDELLSKYGNERIVFDHSQAFFSQPKECLATLYSPRKFFGVPDGGLLVTNLRLEEPEEIDMSSIYRTEHLMKRLAGEPEDGYSSYQEAEKSLDELSPKRMSLLTQRLLESIDYSSVLQRRNKNFNKLQDSLCGSNKLGVSAADNDGPMLYPYVPDSTSSKVKSELINLRCYVASYWPECTERGGEVERFLAKNLLALPCDQRLGDSDILMELGYVSRILS